MFLPYSWFVALVGIGAVILAIWSFHSSAPRWLWALRNAILVTLACMILTLVIVFVATFGSSDTPHNPTPETIPPGIQMSGS